MKNSNLSDRLSWVGMVVVLVAYVLSSLGYLALDNLYYPLLNLVGAILLGVNVYLKKAYATVVLEVVWGSVALFTLGKIFFGG
ncbi:MAG: hypothetical protein WCJ84_04895 [Candidatus Peregrinibacteria bacterium]